jgi:AraC-like DNA-binding protein
MAFPIFFLEIWLKLYITIYGVRMETIRFNKNCESFIRYLNYSPEEEKQYGMICTNTGHVRTMPNNSYPQYINMHPVPYRSVAYGRVLNEFQISYYTFGEETFETENGKYTVTPGSMSLVLPGFWHRMCPTFEVGSHGYWVGFKGNYFSKLVTDEVLSEQSVFFDGNQDSHILSIYYRIFNEVIAQEPVYQLRVCSEILSLIAELLKRKQENQEQSNNDHWWQIVEKAKNFMDINIYNDIDLSHIAGELGVSLSLLHKIFKTYTSFTPYQYYIDAKITVAKTLLEDKTSVKDTAYQLGFEDQLYFSRLFRHKTGFSPKKWKKRDTE